MKENNIEKIELMVENKQVGEETFTQLRGGFDGKESVVISDLQVAELLGYATGARHVRRIVDRNKESFKAGLHLLDIKGEELGVSSWHTYKDSLISMGYTAQSITQAKNIYIFSKSGFLLLLKFAEGENAINLYKNFIESYFELEEKLEVVTEALEETTEALQANAVSITKEMAMLQVELAYEPDENVRLSLLERVQELNQLSIQSNRALEKKRATDEILSKFQHQLTFAQNLEDTKESTFDIGDFAKVLNLKGMGRNKLMEWLREEKILMGEPNKNIPYQQHTGNHFKVVYIETKKGIVSKTVLTGLGVTYIVKRLIKAGILEASVDSKTILAQLESQ